MEAETPARASAPIRSVSRAMAVLQAVNRLKNPTLMELSRTTNLPYPTVFRLMQTLMFEGLVEPEVGRKRYVATSLTQTLSNGFQAEDHLATLARAPMRSLTQEHGWPVALAVKVGSRMMVKESTHLQSSMTFSNYYPGFTLPILDCAAGKTTLAFLPQEELDIVLRGFQELYSIGLEESLSLVDARYLAGIRQKGYAVQSRNQFTQDPGKTSSLAVPVLIDGWPMASLALIFFASGMSVSDAVARYLEPMQSAANEIEKAYMASSSYAQSERGKRAANIK